MVDGYWYRRSQCLGCIGAERHANTVGWLARHVGAEAAEAAGNPTQHAHQAMARLALRATDHVDNHGRRKVRVVAITGGVGSGKTTVAAAHVYTLKTTTDTRVMWVREGRLLRGMKTAHMDDETGVAARAMIERARHAPVLVVDEFGSWGRDGWTKKTLRVMSELLADRFEDGRLVTVVIGNESISWPDSRVASRFDGCGKYAVCEGVDLRSGGCDQ